MFMVFKAHDGVTVVLDVGTRWPVVALADIADALFGWLS
jgi:hypothetical protein